MKASTFERWRRYASTLYPMDCGTKIHPVQAILITSDISTTIRYLHADSE